MFFLRLESNLGMACLSRTDKDIFSIKTVSGLFMIWPRMDEGGTRLLKDADTLQDIMNVFIIIPDPAQVSK